MSLCQQYLSLILLTYNAFHAQIKALPCPGKPAGWRCNYKKEYSQRDNDHFFCDLDIISKHTSWEEFESKYYFKKPVIINTTLSDWAINASFWNKKSLLSSFGNHQFEVGKTYEGTINSGIMQSKMNLFSYLNQQFKKGRIKNRNKLYLFDRSLLRSRTRKYIYENIINITAVPYFNAAHNNIINNYINIKNKNFRNLYNSEYNSRVITIGRTGTGLSFHHHGESWLFSIYGRKRFFIYPPHTTPVGGFGAGFSAYEWFKHIYKHLHMKYDLNNDELYTFKFNQTFIKPRSSIFNRKNGSALLDLNAQSNVSAILSTDYTQYNNAQLYGVLFKPIECILLEGQTIYLPESWWHQVLNLGDALSIGMQINNENIGFSPMSNWSAHVQKHRKNFKNKQFLEILNKTDLEIDALKIENLVNVRKRILKGAPFSAVQEYLIGNNLCLMGKRFWDIGRKHLFNAILMDPTYIYAYLTLGDTYLKEGKVAVAHKILQIAYALNRNHDIVARKLSQILMYFNQTERAQYVLKRKRLPDWRK